MSLIRIDDDRWIESSDVTSVAVAGSKVTVTLRSGTEVYLPCKPGNSVPPHGGGVREHGERFESQLREEVILCLL